MNDRSRPAKAAPEVMAATAASIALIGDVSRQIGFESAVLAIHEAGCDVARAAGDVWAHPRFADLETLRAPDHRPCPAKCRRCSRCVHSLAYWARGGTPYPGTGSS